MSNGQKCYQIILRHPDGHPLVRLIADCEVEIVEPDAPQVPDLPARRERQNSQAPAQGDEPRMTEPQKRYLFRLLGAQGIEGKKAEDHLKEYFRVKTLREVSKAGASQLIEEMIRDRKEAESA